MRGKWVIDAWTFIAVALIASLIAVSSVGASPTIFPTGVTIYKPDKTYNCYVLFDGRDMKSRLIDMNGNEVKVWNYIGLPVEMIDPRLTSGERGHLFVQKEGPILAAKSLAELDWNGKIVWEWGKKAPGGKADQHHDQCRLVNGNTLLLSKIVHIVPKISQKEIIDECIYEVSPNGEIVWKWISSEHFDEFGFSPEAKEKIRSGFVTSFPNLGFLVINDMAPLGPNKWYKAGDERFHPDNIMIDSRDGNFIAIIEKKTGKIVWRLGPEYPGMYESPHTRAFNHKVPRPVDQISGQHDAHMIPEGLPGAGNVLVFDNQGSGGYPPAYLFFWPGSRILEIDPIKKEIVWQYNAEDSDKPLWTFFSSFISSARRLPNGNTLICEGMNGRIFQITPEGEIVWEYINPHFGEIPRGEEVMRNFVRGAKPVPSQPAQEKSERKGLIANWIYRAQPVPYDWVPEGTSHSEIPVIPPEVSEFRIAPAK